MSIQSSITQPLSLMGLLATQTSIVKEGQAIAKADKRYQLAKEAADTAYNEIELSPRKYDDSKSVEARIQVAESSATAKSEAAAELRKLKPTEKNIRQEASAIANEGYTQEQAVAHREEYENMLEKRSEAAMRKKADDHLAEKRDALLETMRRTNPEAVAAYETIYGKGGMR